jgi:hypothetical protein
MFEAEGETRAVYGDAMGCVLVGVFGGVHNRVHVEKEDGERTERSEGTKIYRLEVFICTE